MGLLAPDSQLGKIRRGPRNQVGEPLLAINLDLYLIVDHVSKRVKV